MKTIPYARQTVDEIDVQAVADILRSDFLTQGPIIERFEKAVAAYCGVKYAVAVNSATSALHIACLAAGLGPGDVLCTSPNTFVASANCARYCGADVDFVDIDERTYNMSAERLADKLCKAAKKGKLPKVIIPVHFAGQSCRMDEIGTMAKQYGITVIEDASHAIGGRYKGRPIGCCAYSDMVVFSFHPVKIITTGEGGMVLTNREDLYKKLLLYRSHGIIRDPAQMENEPHGSWYYEQTALGYNYRMTDIQAALGLSQLAKLDRFVACRIEIARKYDTELADLPLILPWQDPDGQSAWHLYVVRVDVGKTEKTRREVFDSLRASGIGVNVHYIPVHTQPYYQRLGFKPGDFPIAEQYYQEAVSLPMYYSLTAEEQAYVIDSLKQVLK
ncbi:UDP-4-amino-4,6-dideoxy-N-acetyl-beta-L-altrosamine transaminase [Sporolituus thermophilus]|uniref:UDP-4-amino-4,6-dideoxy-N-acetyl-beta-L-altrosamine transaminase n=1 Tax=Sporolituus thermophilus DSM 23256 TaxID=1123285 RepID=A0A1G7P0C4_9FIRM|nr:UDP-4-amino-4,6-dideoxy-N-acetyl-beta-L-altrosamine transaminase [Sporolituus thermophilus]SDF79756.1 UDP-4-amino-4,6-dideoxy-N-acetyl-beta-L-altrosamine transaminase [Sporolituus thermophilus DSM 23256]